MSRADHPSNGTRERYVYVPIIVFNPELLDEAIAIATDRAMLRCGPAFLHAEPLAFTHPADILTALVELNLADALTPSLADTATKAFADDRPFTLVLVEATVDPAIPLNDHYRPGVIAINHDNTVTQITAPS